MGRAAGKQGEGLIFNLREENGAYGRTFCARIAYRETTKSTISNLD